MSGNTVTIDADELQALRVLAGRYLSSSESHGGSLLDASEACGDGGDSGESAPLLVGLDVQVDDPHPDWYKLTLNERSAMCRLAAVYPDHLAPEDMLTRFRRTAQSPELEKPLPDPGTHVCMIRSQLGADAIETVWQYRINRKGHRVRVGRCLGYRLGQRYAGETA